MITNDGKEIISKYLLGQVPEYATHLAIGCGATPLDANDPVPTSSFSNQRLDFEMTRVPISSKGFVDDSVTYSVTHKQLVSNVATLTTSVNHDISIGETVVVDNVDNSLNGQFTVTATTSNTFSYFVVGTDISPAVALSPTGSALLPRTKMSLTAELPTDNRYEVTEVGIWSAASNSLASQYDSRNLFNFTGGWQIHDVAISDPPINTNLGFNGSSTTVDIQETSSVFYANTADPIFQVSTRKDRKEGPRHLNRTLMIRGDFSNIDDSGGIDSDWTASGPHVHLNNIGFDISGNNTSDLLKLAFCMIDKTATAQAAVKDTKILVEFFKNEVTGSQSFAKMQIYVPGTTLDANRYFVAKSQISQNIDYTNESASTTLPYIRFYTSPDFASTEIKIARIFVSVTKANDSLSSDHYIAFDGFRLDNTTQNPTYKMSGYSIIRNDGLPIVKSANSNNYIDFRFSLGVS